MKNIINKLLDLYNSPHGKRVFNYLVIGVFTTAVSYSSYALMLHQDMNVNLANTFSIIFAIIFAYVMNKLYVFKTRCSTRKIFYLELFSFFSSRFFSMIVEIGSVFVLYSIFSVHEMLAKIFAGVIVLILNYFVSHYIVFRERAS